MRVMALDVGERRIGVAISDPLGISAQGVEVYERRGLEQDLAVGGLFHYLATSSYRKQRTVCPLPKS